MLTGMQRCEALAEAFGVSTEVVRIALAGVPGTNLGRGMVYETGEAARAVVKYCKARARDAELRYESCGSPHGGGYTRNLALKWNERAARIRRAYLTKEAQK